MISLCLHFLLLPPPSPAGVVGSPSWCDVYACDCLASIQVVTLLVLIQQGMKKMQVNGLVKLRKMVETKNKAR